ncbi:DgyrCDS12059 [Dimorphilus gyrociliatus]|uniref:DgyrCDS12059 n=1 Tax=Dimorphilus gyrociliatus TaxID=2664684 RepID=A0A7I8W8G5_9ANNE|nr:DgyrCDS12059 [Dimorphilus gyrociliatus]
MHIKRVELRGFKSYGEMTILDNFDRNFNAITGLNGSGKSNIFDAICFCLGLHALKSMRVTHTKDLIFKEGTGNVTEAHVSIIFDNTDKNNRPIGYEDTNEISITRSIKVNSTASRYTLNGNVSSKEKIEEMLASVRINMKNPTFIILQGRIKQVINMTPIETLGMVEEVIGTKNYEKKKADAVKTIEEKNQKLIEIENLIDNTIRPHLIECESAKEVYDKYEQAKREYDYVHKKLIAYDFFKNTIKIEKLTKDKEEQKSVIEKQKKELEENKEKQEDLRGRIKTCEDDLKNNQEMIESNKNIHEKQKEKAKIQAQVNLIEKDVKDDEKNIKDLQNKKVKMENNATHQNNEYIEGKNRSENLLKVYEESTKQLQRATDSYMAASAGRQMQQDGRTLTVHEKLNEAEKDLIRAQGSIKEYKMNIKHTERKLKEKSSKLAKEGNKGEEEKLKLKKLENEKLKIEKRLEACNHDPEIFEQMQVEAEKLLHEIQKLEKSIGDIRTKHGLPELDYTPPVNFRKEEVHGMVYELFKVKEEKYTTAVEFSFQGITSAVLSSDNTASKIAKYLQRTYNLLCMDKLMKLEVSEDKMIDAKRICKDVHNLMDLLEYDTKYARAIQRSFPPTIVCPDTNTAFKVCKSVKVNTVSLDGDTYSPQGLISGGSAQKQTRMLGTMKLYDALQTLKPKKEKYLNLKNEISKMSKIHNEYENIRHQMNQITGEEELQREIVSRSADNELRTECDNLKQELTTYQCHLEDAETKLATASSLVKQYKNEAENFEATKERILKEASEGLAKAKKNEAKAKKEYENFVEKFSTVQNARSTYQDEISELEEDMIKLKELNQKREEEIKCLLERISSIDVVLQELDEKRQKIEETFSEKNKEIKTFKDSLRSLEENSVSKSIDMNGAENSLKDTKRELENRKNYLRKLNEENPFISEEQNKFGQSGTNYDFEFFDIRKLEKEEGKWRKKLDEFNKNTNIRAAEAYVQKKNSYDELIEKKRIVLDDKKNLQIFINSVDAEKDEAIKYACQKVNVDFNNIFAMLLPNAGAELKAYFDTKNNHKINGLQIRVHFGGKWKESLDELSGGQKSLMSLSLLLALLRCKPCPFYILDEIDAALDTSHTQNVGQVIHTFFRDSQFLIISLKQNLFASADVLYKVSNMNGLSKVERIFNAKR